MNTEDIKAVYFVGAGGIGMSAIARYFLKKGHVVAGYDKTPFIHRPSRQNTKNSSSSVRTALRSRNAPRFSEP